MSEIVNAAVDMALIKPHPRNYKNHPDEQIAQLGMSHARLSQFRSVVLWSQSDGSYITLAGHGIIEAMKRNKVTQVRADIHPVTLSAADAEAILLADNLHAQNSTDDEQALAHLLQEQQDAGFDLSSLGSDDETLRQMLENLGDSYLGGSGEQEDGAGGDEFDAQPDEEQTRVNAGDIWQLGRHRIGCFDSRDVNALPSLLGGAAITYIWSDPPYGISIVKKDGHIGSGKTHAFLHGERVTFPENTYAFVIGDESTETAVSSFLLCQEMFPKALQIWWGANHYSAGLPSSSCWIVWDKENDATDFADAELAWCSSKGAVRIFRHMWNGMVRASEQGIRRVHPNQKPVAMCRWAYEKFGKENDVVFDPFLGSGISVIAAERMGDRTVYGCELSPAYINVILNRWEAETGKEVRFLDRVQEVAHG